MPSQHSSDVAGSLTTTPEPTPTSQVASKPRGVNLWRVAGLTLFLAFVAVFGLFPLVHVVRMAFSSVDLAGGSFAWSFNGLDNFATVLSEPASWQAALNTVIFVVATTVGSIVTGLALALLVYRAVIMLPVARNLLIWPAIVAPVIVSLMWLLVLSPTAGGLNKLLGSLGLPEQEWLNSQIGAMLSVVVVDLWHWTPVTFLFIYAALMSIDAEVLEAGRVDGASEWQILRHIIIPLLKPAIIGVAAIRIIMGIKAFDELFLITGGGPNGATTLVSQNIRDLFFISLRFGEAAAYGLLVLAAIAIGLAVFALVRSLRKKAA